jgi:hypothetical protein
LSNPKQFGGNLGGNFAQCPPLAAFRRPGPSITRQHATTMFLHFVGDACSREPLIRAGLIEALDY